MDSLISTFNLDWKIIIAQLVNFAIVFFVLYKYALKPLSTLMSERKKTIEQGLMDARLSAQKIEEVSTLYNKELAQAQIESQKLLQEMKQEIETKREDLINKAHLEAEKIIKDGQISLENQKNKMIHEAKKEVGIIVGKALENILSDSLDSETKNKLVKKAISEI